MDIVAVEFLQNISKKFYPEKRTSGCTRHSKPTLIGRLCITEEQSTELARYSYYHEGFFMFFTEEIAAYFVVNTDVLSNTLVIKPMGFPGFRDHIVYKYEGGITSKQLEKFKRVYNH